MSRPRRALAWLLSISLFTLSSTPLLADTKGPSGFGARPGFGVRDLLVLVDGVPILDADGFTRVAQIDLGSAERLEVIKGPSSALYGNAAFGGVLDVITRRGAIGPPAAPLPGVPGQRGSLSLATRREGLNGRVVYERVGKIFLDDANTQRQGDYDLLSASLTYDRRHWSVFLHGTNLTDERYASSVAVNDPFGNYFVPAPGRAIAGGVDVRF